MLGLTRGGVGPGDEAQAELPGRADRDVHGVSGGAVAEGDHPGKRLYVPGFRFEGSVYHPLGEPEEPLPDEPPGLIPAVAVPLVPVAGL